MHGATARAQIWPIGIRNATAIRPPPMQASARMMEALRPIFWMIGPAAKPMMAARMIDHTSRLETWEESMPYTFRPMALQPAFRV